MDRLDETLNQLRGELDSRTATLCIHAANDRFIEAAREASEVRKLLLIMEQKKQRQDSA
jgi:hypothetical protein